MKQLSGQRGWEYAFKKKLEDDLDILRDLLEVSEGRTMEQYHYLSGQAKGLRIALDGMEQAREKYKLDDDAD